MSGEDHEALRRLKIWYHAQKALRREKKEELRQQKALSESVKKLILDLEGRSLFAPFRKISIPTQEEINDLVATFGHSDGGERRDDNIDEFVDVEEHLKFLASPEKFVRGHQSPAVQQVVVLEEAPREDHHFIVNFQDECGASEGTEADEEDVKYDLEGAPADETPSQSVHERAPLLTNIRRNSFEGGPATVATFIPSPNKEGQPKSPLAIMGEQTRGADQSRTTDVFYFRVTLAVAELAAQYLQERSDELIFGKFSCDAQPEGFVSSASKALCIVRSNESSQVAWGELTPMLKTLSQTYSTVAVVFMIRSETKTDRIVSRSKFAKDKALSRVRDFLDDDRFFFTYNERQVWDTPVADQIRQAIIHKLTSN